MSDLPRGVLERGDEDDEMVLTLSDVPGDERARDVLTLVTLVRELHKEGDAWRSTEPPIVITLRSGLGRDFLQFLSLELTIEQVQRCRQIVLDLAKCDPHSSEAREKIELLAHDLAKVSGWL